jgi:ribosomal protein S18 acetylase RimI-like enzyme
MTAKIKSIETSEDIESLRTLFHEYARTLGFDLSFQGFDEEVESLPGKYVPPEGCLLIAVEGQDVLGCVALRKTEGDVCEMKRLFVRPEHRGKGIGRELVHAVINASRDMGYTRMRLDTISSMKEAIALYRSLGFHDTKPYCYNPVPEAVFLELDL